MKSKEEILDGLFGVLSSSCFNNANIPLTKDTHLVDHLKFDRIDRMDFVIEVENKFGIELGSEFEALNTLGQMVDYLYDKRI